MDDLVIGSLLTIGNMTVSAQEVYNKSDLPKKKEFISTMIDGSLLYKDTNYKVRNNNDRYYLLRECY
jgi:hypothetical protein